MSSQSRLIPVSYYNASQEVRLSAYADTIVYEQEGPYKNTLRAVRFGGYPEMVRGLADAVYAGGTLEVNMGEYPMRLESQAKRYRRQVTHDGVYAEATLLSIDDVQETKTPENDGDGDEEQEEQAEIDLPPRKCIIFCPENDRDRLFEEVDRKTAVPLIPEFRDYVLDELEQRGILKRLQVISLREKLDAWVLLCRKDDANIISVVEDGLKSGAISIPGTVTDPDGFDGVENVTGYLNTFGVTVAERIRGQFQPLFDPASEPLSPEILAINNYIHTHAGYSLYDAQLAVAEAVKRQLQKHKCGFIVAECGSGKSKIGATAMAAVYALRAEQAGRGRQKTFNVILCPSHVADKWAREISETLPDTAGVVVRSNMELDRLYELYEKGDKSIYAIITKEKARDGFMRQPAVIWNRRKQAYLCPDCMMPVEASFKDDGIPYTGKVNQFFFRTENSRNHTCANCGSPLWAPVNPGHAGEWVKVGAYGWIHRSHAAEHFLKTKHEPTLEQIRIVAENPDGYYPVVGACRRYPMSSYIKRRYRGRLDGCIVDELHEYNNDSGQGDAMAEIFSAAERVIGMTATLINGYSSGIFHLLYRVCPGLMLQDGKRHSAPADFDAEYGVVENTFEEEDDYAANRRAHRRKTRTRQLPGVSPLVYSRFLLEQTAFLSLSDMGKDLPDYEEIPIPLDMEEKVAEEYRRVENILRKILKAGGKGARRILSAYLNLLTVYPDQPYSQPPIVDPGSGEKLVEPDDMGDFDTIGEKERAVLDIVRNKVEHGERVLVYTSWTRTESQKKLLKLLTGEGYRTEIMSEKIRPRAREEWVQKRLAAGLQVLITNPSLVETGLDLNAFTTLIFYSMGYKLFTLRQASRRSWRINQTAPRVEVYLLYYKDTMQHKAMKLMASKLAVAGIIEGNFTEEGLAAMSDVQDMTSQMAKELMLGIRDNVEDIASAFKRMAVINPGRSESKAENTAGESETEEAPPARDIPEALFAESPPVSTPLPKPAGPRRHIDLEKTAELAATLEKAQKPKRTRKTVVDENQLTLFDFVA